MVTSPQIMDAFLLAAVEDPGALMAARVLMTFTLVVHIVFACLGVGMPVMMLFAEWRHLKTGDEGWKVLAKTWSKVFTITFAVGAATGTALSFELGVLWPEFMGTFGAVFGPVIAVEGVAFFIEGVFLGLYLYGWERLSPRLHFICGLPLAFATALSAWLIVAVNAWMNHPGTSFVMEQGRVTSVDLWQVFFPPAIWSQGPHMILAAYMTAGFLVASWYAWRRLRGEQGEHAVRAMKVALCLGLICAPLQVAVGDFSGKYVADNQPLKLAAMEAVEETGPRKPIRVGPLEIPTMLSWLAYQDPDAVVKGFNEWPEEDRPPVKVVRHSFLTMVLIGFFLAGVSVWAAGSLVIRRKLPSGTFFLLTVLAAGPLTVLAMETGWFVTEVGRQPWVVQGVMRTSEAAGALPFIRELLVAVVLLYAFVVAGTVLVLRHLGKQTSEAELS